jgi:hypothetical protein
MRNVIAAVLACALAQGAGAAVTSVPFDSGAEGWSINGFDTVSQTGGNPGANIALEIIDTFGISVRNSTNAKFIGDFTQRGPTRVSIDFKVNYIRFFGQDVTRDIVLELRDYDNPQGGFPYTSVWFNAGELPNPEDGWRTYSFDIIDVNSAALPPGWGGTGAEDPDTFEPILPPGRTWANVLAGVDEVQFTTFVPGFFYGFTDFNVAVDNIRFEAIPAPGMGSMIGLGGLGALRRRRIA